MTEPETRFDLPFTEPVSAPPVGRVPVQPDPTSSGSADQLAPLPATVVVKPNPNRVTSAQSQWVRIVLGLVALLGIILGSAAWAISSPLGTTPDEDFHLGSIWCPRPIDGSGCEYRLENGEFASVLVPETVALPQHCMAFQPNVNASCSNSLSDDRLVYSGRFDTGGYPRGFYRFHHMFVGPDVHQSVVIMRLVNVLITFGALALIALLAPLKQRGNLIIAAMAAWVPMGVYFIASVNPSSWTIAGCLIFASALISAIESTVSWRRWALLALAVFGVWLTSSSRIDGAFYLFVIALTIVLLFPITKKALGAMAVAVAASAYGIYVFLSSTQANSLSSDGGWPTSDGSTISVFVGNILSLPDFIGSLWGLDAGPGWFDVPLSGWSTLTMLFVAGGIVFVGLSDLTVRKVLSLAVITGALLGIPVVSLTMRHVQPVTYYQGRYMLPLLAVFFLVVLMRRNREPAVNSIGQLVTLGGVVVLANSLALVSLIVRYTVGIEAGLVSGLLEPVWWPWAVPPIVVWVSGSIAMTLGVVASLTFVATRHPETVEKPAIETGTPVL